MDKMPSWLQWIQYLKITYFSMKIIIFLMKMGSFFSKIPYFLLNIIIVKNIKNRYLCALKYGVNLGSWSEFSKIPFDDSFPPFGFGIPNRAIRDQFFASQQIKSDEMWLYALALLGIFLFFRIFANLFLAWNGRTVF